MESGFVHTTKPVLNNLGLNDFPHDRLIENERAYLKIIKRHPKQGQPAEGQRFAIDVEVWSKKPFWTTDLGCEDLTVVAYEPQRRKIIAFTNIEPSAFMDCVGTATLRFDEEFKGQSWYPVMLEVISNNNFELKPSDLDLKWETNPLLRSGIITLEKGESEGRNDGLYANPTSPWYENQGFMALNTTMKRIITIAGIGAAVYFTAPFFPVIRRSIKGLAGAAESVQKSND